MDWVIYICTNIVCFVVNVWKIYKKAETKFTFLDIAHKWNSRTTI